MELTNEERALLKGKGFITMRDKNFFSCRVVVNAGKLSAEQIQKLSEICKQYGRGYLTMTHRVNVHIPWVKYEDLEQVSQAITQVGLSIGGTGMRPRPAHCCKGFACTMATYDSEALAETINQKIYQGYYQTKLPSKFRIELSGCPNNCSKVQTACVGLKGKSPGKVGIFLGGLVARKCLLGQEISGTYSLTDAVTLVEKAVQYYQQNGQPGERFALMVERVGFAQVEQDLLSGFVPQK